MIAAKWDITSKCNLRCSHCSVAGMYFSTLPYQELELANKLAVLDNIAKGGVKYLSLLGGEPLILRKELLTVVAHAKELGMTVGIVTNGILLFEETCRELIDIGLDRITVSIESTQAMQHDQIRGRGNFEKLVANLNRFVTVRGGKEYPKLAINSVLTRVNKFGFVDIARFCRSLGANEWTALTLNYVGNAQKNLSNLVLDPIEHTEVALELARQLPSLAPESSNFTINIQLIFPLVWEFIIKKYDVIPPWPQICCSAAKSLVYIAPNGEMHLCDRVHGSGSVQIRGTDINPVNLVDSSFAAAWAADQYSRMFEFVKDPDTYKNFKPCRHCKYLAAGLCEPCPLYSLEGSNTTFSQCLEAEQFLGDISDSVDWDLIPASEKRGRYEEAWILDDHDRESFNILARPTTTVGVRHFRYPSGDAVIFDPDSIQSLKLNPLANAMWESFDGRRTAEQIIAHASELYTHASESFARKTPTEAELIRLAAQTKNLMTLMQERGFIVLR